MGTQRIYSLKQVEFLTVEKQMGREIYQRISSIVDRNLSVLNLRYVRQTYYNFLEEFNDGKKLRSKY